MKGILSFLLIIFVLSSCKQRDRTEHRSRENNRKSITSTSVDTRTRSAVNDYSLQEADRKIVAGRVVRITDGDTFTLLLDNNFETGVRLNGIDCPEKKQAFSQRAKKELSDLIFDKEVTIYYDKKDGFGRVLGDVYLSDMNINQEMVRRGMAWHYVKYSNDEILVELEKEARRNRVGLWSDPNPIAPWEYRSK